MFSNPKTMHHHAHARPHAGGVVAAAPSTPAALPFDHAATFELTGKPGNIVNGVLNITTEGTFVAVAIGYGFEEDRARPIELTLATFVPPGGLYLPADTMLGELPAEALVTGFRVRPDFQSMVFADGSASAARPVRNEPDFADKPVPPGFASQLFEQLKAPEEISFLFSALDSGSGRELQDAPTFNLASLGSSGGRRPFRVLSQPLTFQPRSTVRLQVIEKSEGVRGTLFIVLYGYKDLTGCRLPFPASATRPGGTPASRVIPFDYVSTLPLSGRPGNLVEQEISINVEGGFVATSIGYGLAPEEQDVKIQFSRIGDIQRLISNTGAIAVDRLRAVMAAAQASGLVDLSVLPLRLFPPSALVDGIRIRPSFLRIALGDGGTPSAKVPIHLVDQIFERLNRPEDVSFRYAIHDSGTGRDLQNQPIHNIAGLGSAGGERPFKRLAQPLISLPRSTLRVSVEERFGRGNLYMVFQGFKVLGAAGGTMP